MKNVVKFESKPKAEKKGFVVKTAVKAGFNPGDVADEQNNPFHPLNHNSPFHPLNPLHNS